MNILLGVCSFFGLLFCLNARLLMLSINPRIPHTCGCVVGCMCPYLTLNRLWFRIDVIVIYCFFFLFACWTRMIPCWSSIYREKNKLSPIDSLWRDPRPDDEASLIERHPMAYPTANIFEYCMESQIQSFNDRRWLLHITMNPCLNINLRTATPWIQPKSWVTSWRPIKSYIVFALFSMNNNFLFSFSVLLLNFKYCNSVSVSSIHLWKRRIIFMNICCCYFPSWIFSLVLRL